MIIAQIPFRKCMQTGELRAAAREAMKNASKRWWPENNRSYHHQNLGDELTLTTSCDSTIILHQSKAQSYVASSATEPTR